MTPVKCAEMDDLVHESSVASNVEHLYIHIPFCAAKCGYCAFYSRPGSTEQMSDCVDAVLAELERLAPQLVPATIFIGGGTPTVLSLELLRRLLKGSAARVPLGGVGEWTVECNPATVDGEKVELFREFGVNRISMGVQSFDDALLKAIGRIHSAKAAVATYELLRQSGFENINLDLMFGLPGQTITHFRDTLRRAIELQPEHISVYCLILERETEFWRQFQSGRLSTNEEQNAAMYELAIDTLEAAGYRQYEVSNFAKPGCECVHNIAYWKVEDYIGLGPSACSTVGTRRWQNAFDTERYIAAMRKGEEALAYEEVVTPKLRAAERAAFGMRMNAGVPAELVRGHWDKEIAELLSAELVQWRNGRLAPTRRGILFADEVSAEFV